MRQRVFWLITMQSFAPGKLGACNHEWHGQTRRWFKTSLPLWQLRDGRNFLEDESPSDFIEMHAEIYATSLQGAQVDLSTVKEELKSLLQYAVQFISLTIHRILYSLVENPPFHIRHWVVQCFGSGQLLFSLPISCILCRYVCAEIETQGLTWRAPPGGLVRNYTHAQYS